ncbi:SDR family NAD(P)-dependent oxidoreductase [Paenibacillus thermoaerophilus]|jgi:short-subunit dehydrogenase|uniref:SDR family NAD(P)-dependent oxidoreductase n=1 Tax=Paenibacillus thermoaerophilus TaxID=1215385 RepID=A0ABW2V276_9BACL
MMPLKGKIVAITGASSGIGAAMAKSFAERGATVVLMARSTAELEALAVRLPGPAYAVRLDVTSDESVAAAFAETAERAGSVDVLVNNAGFARYGAVSDMSVKDYAAMMDVNYLGAVRCTKAVLPDMLERDTGHLVYTASILGKIGSARASAYAASKHALLGFVNSMRLELAGTGIAVTAINPGSVDTPFFGKADPGGAYAAKVKRFMLKPSEVAENAARAVERRMREVDLPAYARWGARLFGLWPGGYEKMAAKFLNKLR